MTPCYRAIDSRSVEDLGPGKTLQFNERRRRDFVVVEIAEIAEIAEILIKNSYKTEGTEILNKIYPIIIDYFKEKSATVVWKPNIEDNVFGLIYCFLWFHVQNSVFMVLKIH